VGGAFHRAVDYGLSPEEAAREWERQGASRLHVVDLEGAREGRVCHLEEIGRIARAVSIPVQAGGGLRSEEEVEELLRRGVRWAILGTRALRDPGFAGRLAERHPGRILVSLDLRSPHELALSGWLSGEKADPLALAWRLAEMGVREFVVTDVGRDGSLEGVREDFFSALAERLSPLGVGIYAAGGVGRIEDVRTLAGLRRKGLRGVIVGRALYEGRFSLREAREAAEGKDAG
jgi:phosphoribosylformimino-5-aminoimidazole carboxamide ribotide isomerase